MMKSKWHLVVWSCFVVQSGGVLAGLRRLFSGDADRQ